MIQFLQKMFGRSSNLSARLTMRRATQMVEGSASIQLVCPYCGDVQTQTVIAVWGGTVVYRCEKTYEGAGCGRQFTGPA